jgi:Carboxypeptidase regulatory-like domain
MLRLLRLVLPLILAASALARQAASAPADTGFHISGTVVSALNGQALADTEVSIGRTDTGDTAKSMTTSQNGRFDFDGLPPGKYWLAAEKSGFTRQSFEEHQGYFTGIAVGPRLQSENLLFRLRPDASVSGVVTDDQNDPVREAQVLLFHSAVENGASSTRSRGQATTDDQGRYHFTHLEPGRYFVAVSARPWYARSQQQYVGVNRYPGIRQRTENVPREDAGNSTLDVAYPFTFYSGTTEASSATALDLKSGDHADADVTLTPVRAIHLRIRDPDVQADQGQRPQMSVILSQHVFGDASTAVVGQTIDNDNGGFEISGIAPGQFVVTLETYGKDAKRWTRNVNLSGDAEVSMTGSTTLAMVSGKVELDGDGGLQRQAFVEFRNRSASESFDAPISAGGRFTASQAPVEPGAYEISVLNIPGAMVESVTAVGAKAAGRNLEIDGTAPVELTVRLATRLGLVKGTVLRGGKPVSGAMVLLIPAEPEKNYSLFRRDQSDSDGTFTLPDVFPGTYTLLAIEDGWDLEWSSPSALSTFMKAGESIRVFPDAKLQVQVQAQ